MRTKKDRDVYENIDLIMTFIGPYAIGIANIVCFVIMELEIKSIAPNAISFVIYPSIFLHLFLLNSSKRNKMCRWHRRLILCNLFVSVTAGVDEVLYSFSDTGVDIVCVLSFIQLISVMTIGVIHFKYGMCE